MAIRNAAPNLNDVEERSRRSQDEGAGPRETSQKKLCTKIRNQAKELAALTERLQEEAAYSRLVEKRLVELDPEHSLPVTPRHLGCCSPEGTKAHHIGVGVGGLGCRYHQQKADRLSNEEHDHDDGLRQGYEAAQARLRDAAQLIRTLREALESRDADANAAANRARKYQREADDLRRRLETGGGNVRRASKGGGGGGGRDGENPTRSSPLGGEQGHGRGHGVRFDDDNRTRQHQQHVELSKDVERLEQELREQREATAAARTEANGLHETLKQLQQLQHVGNLSFQREGAADDAKANAAELARQLARARSTAESSRAENKNLRRQLRELGGGGSGHGRGEGGSGSGNSSHISKTMPRSTNIARSSSGGHASLAAAALRGRHTPAAGPKPAPACELGGTRAENVEGGGGEGRGGNELEAEKEALLDYVQDLLGRIKGLEAACASLERERGDSSRNIEKTRKELQQKENAIAQTQSQIEDFQKTEKVERAEKEEMGRLYNELLEQLKTAEEEKESLQSKAKQADTRESSISQDANSLREQLDQCLQRLTDEQNCAAESSRQAKEERADLENALSSANSRLAKMDALEADTKAQAEELKELREQKRERDASLAEGQSRTQHLAGALRELELESAALSSREREAVSRAEGLEQELHHLESKVSKLSLRCEELQKHVVVLQSGEEVQGSHRKAAEAFALAERQDELLEDASARLGHLKAESKLLREELAKTRESSETAKNILEPVLQGARSQLGLESDGSCDHHPTAMAAATRKHRRKQAHSFNSECGSQEDFEVENGAGQRQARLDEGGEDEVELEDLAREAADVLLHVLVGAEVGHGMGENKEPEGRNGRTRWTATRFQDAGEHAWASTRRRGSARRNSQPKGPLRTSNLTASSPRWGIEDAEEEHQSRHHRRRPVGQGTPDHGGTYRAKDVSASIGVNNESASAINRATSISAENRGGTGGTRAKSSCGLSPGAVHFDHRSGVGARRRARSERGVAGAEAVAMPDHDAVRRMEGIRRGGGEDGGATLLHGVKSTRRGHLQGGRPPTSIADSWMNTLLDGNRLSASAEKDTLLSTALAGNSRPRAWVRGGRDDSRQRTTSLGCQSPSARNICQRIHDAQTALQTLRRTTD